MKAIDKQKMALSTTIFSHNKFDGKNLESFGPLMEK